MLGRSTATLNLGVNLTLEGHKGEEVLLRLNSLTVETRSNVVETGHSPKPGPRTLRTKPHGGGTRLGLTVASLVVQLNHGNTNGRSRAGFQPEAGPEEVLEPEPSRGNGRHGPAVADPVMHCSDRRQ